MWAGRYNAIYCIFHLLQVFTTAGKRGRHEFALSVAHVCLCCFPSAVKKMTELKSRGVKMLPSKDNHHKISVCKSDTLIAVFCKISRTENNCSTFPIQTPLSSHGREQENNLKKNVLQVWTKAHLTRQLRQEFCRLTFAFKNSKQLYWSC